MKTGDLVRICDYVFESISAIQQFKSIKNIGIVMEQTEYSVRIKFPMQDTSDDLWILKVWVKKVIAEKSDEDLYSDMEEDSNSNSKIQNNSKTKKINIGLLSKKKVLHIGATLQGIVQTMKSQTTDDSAIHVPKLVVVGSQSSGKSSLFHFRVSLFQWAQPQGTRKLMTNLERLR